MKLEKDLWIENGYYIDFDKFGQFRIIGPNNHLYCGLIDIPRHKIKIDSIKSKNDKSVIVRGKFLSQSINLYYPAMDDIRTIRNIAGDVTFLEARRLNLGRSIPHEIKVKKLKKTTEIKFLRRYGEDFFYSTKFSFPKEVKIKRITKPYLGFNLKTKKRKISFNITAETNEIHKKKFKHFFIHEAEEFDFSVFGKFKDTVEYFLERTSIEVEHLISWGKTSGDNYGTIFPRDWMESADLGLHDLRQDVREYMYKVSLKNVNEKGEGWHEDVVGEYKFEHELAGEDILDRHMIDIEPHYIIGLDNLPEDFLVDKDIREKIRRVAKFIIKKSRENEFITFKKKNKKEYYDTGNWRDSGWAYKKITPPVAPFDVNVVFYPIALKTISKFQKKLNLEVPDLSKLIKKWEKKRLQYLFRNKDGRVAYSLAIYDIKKNKNRYQFKQFQINHLDEAYLYAYDRGNQEEIKSFCQRLLDENYFYTKSGPLIVAKNNNFGYTPAEYHGLVIWTKQVAFTILGLSKHLKIAATEEWPKDIQKLIKNTILTISEDMMRTFYILQAIPEVHYDDHGVPKFYSAQPGAQMSKVQLWSAIGARRIFRKYYEIKANPIYKNI